MRAEECKFSCKCPECEFYSKDPNNLETCEKYSVVVFLGGDSLRKKYQKAVSEIKAIQEEKRGFLYDLAQRELSGERLTEGEKQCADLFRQYCSIQLDLFPWLEDGCEPTNQDGKNLYLFFDLVKRIKSYFGGEHSV